MHRTACCPCRRTASPQTQHTAARQQANRSQKIKRKKENTPLLNLTSKSQNTEIKALQTQQVSLWPQPLLVLCPYPFQGARAPISPRA